MAVQKQPAVHGVDFSDINLSSQPAALHCRKRGSNIQLSENNTVAKRVNPQNGVVMTAKSVPVGAVFQVTVLEKVKGWSGSLVSVVMGLSGKNLSQVQEVFRVLQFKTDHLEYGTKFFSFPATRCSYKARVPTCRAS